MSVEATSPAPERVWSAALIERSLRLWSGVVLFVFVTMHLLNHAVGVFGVAAMTAVQNVRLAIWWNEAGVTVLYGTAAVHMLLALKRVVFRSTRRMPAREAIQLALGLLIPWLVLDHALGTRAIAEFGGFDASYVNVLRNIWPDLALGQIALLAVVWAHGCIGLDYALARQRWYARRRTLFLVFAALVPALAVAGFVSAGREAQTSPAPWAGVTDRQAQVFGTGRRMGEIVFGGLFGAVALALVGRALWRRRGGQIQVRYAGHGAVTSPRGLTLLEISRANHIPHPSACGGRGRCATCRVMVVSGDAGLPPPAGVEKSALDRIRAPQHVRLACQIRPRQDISVRMLIPTPAPGRPAPHANRGFEWGGERELTVMFADMRGFSNLALYQSPADITLLLNRLLDELLEAVELRGGVVASIETDGVLVLFGLDEAAGAGARAAVEAAVDALKVADRLNAEIGVAVTQPIRFGVGLHTGRLVVAEIGDVERGYRLAPIGVTVVIADRLQEATKEFSADCVVSAETLAAARLAPKDGRAVAIHYKNGDAPVAAWAYPTRRELARLLGRREAAEAEPAKAPAASAVIPGETA